jgi:hypothetical protein
MLRLASQHHIWLIVVQGSMGGIHIKRMCGNAVISLRQRTLGITMLFAKSRNGFMA